MTKAELVKTLKEQAGLATLAQAEAAYLVSGATALFLRRKVPGSAVFPAA